MRKTLLILLCFLGATNPSFANSKAESPRVEKPNLDMPGHEISAGEEVLTLEWIDLIPKSERNKFDELGMPTVDHSSTTMSQSKIGAVRTELNGSKVKIPGFVIPLEGDANKVTEFLLVPYFGACIHVPPPPPNQIIYVKFPKGAPVQDLWDVIYLEGTLRTETMNHELAETGYLIEGTSIEAYDDM